MQFLKLGDKVTGGDGALQVLEVYTVAGKVSSRSSYARFPMSIEDERLHMRLAQCLQSCQFNTAWAALTGRSCLSALVLMPGLLMAADDLEQVKQRFRGDWDLVSYVTFPADGDQRDMAYVGTLTYDAFDNMAGIGMPVDLPARSAAAGTRLLEGFAYWGRVEYDLAGGRVIHHVEGSPMVPAWVGQDNIRFFEFTGNYLQLSLRNAEGRTTGTLSWRKRQPPPGLESAAVEVQAAVQHFIDEWNSGDIQRVRATLQYPHVTHGLAGLLIANTPEEFQQDFALLRQQGWASSRIDRVQLYQLSADKAHLGMWFSRLDASGEVYQPGYVFYVFTRMNGRWGMQYRAPGPLPGQVDAVTLQAARAGSEAAIRKFFVDFNNADNTSLRQVNHVPQVMLNQSRFVLARDDSAPIVAVNFAGLRQQENWAFSRIALLNPLSLSADQAIYEVVFERDDANGEHYLTVPAIWVLNRIDGRWGLTYRSLHPPTFERRP